MCSEDEGVEGLSSGQDPQSQLLTPAAADNLLHLNRLDTKAFAIIIVCSYTNTVTLNYTLNKRLTRITIFLPHFPSRCPSSMCRSVLSQPTSYRPRLLLEGRAGSGQSSHLAPAVLHALEKFTVYTLDMAVLFGTSATAPEETCAQVGSNTRDISMHAVT